jgi:DNA-binding response OmpR family regulator
MRVLVVEDQAELADDIADGLRDQGIGADVAYDGPAGIEKALMNSYDVVVLDRDLPGIHGDAVCATLVGTRSAARILMLTAPAPSVTGCRASTLVPTITWASHSPSRNWWPGSGRWPGAARPLPQ